mgnify:CR=1 FL=1
MFARVFVFIMLVLPGLAIAALNRDEQTLVELVRIKGLDWVAGSLVVMAVVVVGFAAVRLAKRSVKRAT